MRADHHHSTSSNIPMFLHNEKMQEAEMFRISMGSSALVIIDVQNEFMSPDGHFPASDACRSDVVMNLKSLIPRFRKTGGHIIWVQAIYENRTEEPAAMKQYPKGDGVVGNNEWLTRATHVFHVSCCEEGSFGAEIYPEILALAGPKDAVVTKSGYSAFNGTTALLDALRERNVRTAYFCGVASGTCVLATVIDAVKLGDIQVKAVPDCMGWRRYNTHEEAIRRMKELGVYLIDSYRVAIPPMSVATLSRLKRSRGAEFK